MESEFGNGGIRKCWGPKISFCTFKVTLSHVNPYYKTINTLLIIFQMSEKAEEAICEQTMADLLYLTENEGKLRLDNFNL